MTGRKAEDDPIREEALDWLLRVENAPGDEALRAAFDTWRMQSPRHEKAYLSVAQAWRLAGDLPADYAGPAPARGLTGSSPRPIDDLARNGGPRQRNVRRRLAVGVAAALAACLAVVLLPALSLRLEADFVTGVGEIRSFGLDDGSTLHLDAESAVAVDYGPSARTLRLLAGRAFFDVVPEAARPFTVSAPGLAVAVTGTEFAVGLDPADTVVAVRSGSVDVAVDGSDGAPARLGAGDRLTLSHETQKVTRSTVPAADVSSWRDGQLVVDGMSLAALVEELDRYHRGIVWLRDSALAERRITGVFNLDDPVAALRAAAGTQNVEVTALTPYLLVVGRR